MERRNKMVKAELGKMTKAELEKEITEAKDYVDELEKQLASLTKKKRVFLDECAG